MDHLANYYTFHTIHLLVKFFLCKLTFFLSIILQTWNFSLLAIYQLFFNVSFFRNDISFFIALIFWINLQNMQILYNYKSYVPFGYQKYQINCSLLSQFSWSFQIKQNVQTNRLTMFDSILWFKKCFALFLYLADILLTMC